MVDRRTAMAAWVCVVALASMAASSAAQDRRIIDLQPFSIITGSADGFGAIRSLAIDSASNIIVGDRGYGRVSSYSKDGRHLWSIGREGDGPGEFRSIRFVGAGRRQVVVYDQTHRRVTRFALPDLRILGSFVVDNARSGARYANGVMRVEGDSVLLFGVAVPVMTPSPGLPFGEELRRYSVTGVLLSTQPVRAQEQDVWTYPTRRGTPQLYVLPYTPWMVWTVNGKGGVTSGWGGAYEIVETDRKAAIERTIRGVGAPLRAPDKDVARARVFMDSVLRLSQAYADAFGRPIVNRTFVFGALSYSPDGRWLWVKRTTLHAEPIFDIYNSGTLKCTLRLGSGGIIVGSYDFVPPVLSSDRIWLVGFNKDDVEVVVGYSIRPLPSVCSG